jgi:hypothetical protein
MSRPLIYTACHINVSKKDGGIIGLRIQLRPNMVVVAKKRSVIGTFFDNRYRSNIRVSG